VDSLQLPAYSLQLIAWNMYKFRFVEFKVYKLAKELHHECVILTNSFPRNFLYLGDQLKRASLSVILNIAEGSGKESDRDFRRYIQIALGSINEVAACLEVAFDEKLIDLETKEVLLSNSFDLKNQLGSFSQKLKMES